MPPVIIAVAAAVSGAVIGSFVIGTALATGIGAAVGMVVSYGLNAAYSAITKPKAKSSTAATTASQANNAQDQQTLIRSSTASRRVIYGQARVSGPIVYAVSTGADKEYLHLVIVLACHPCADVGTVWLNDTAIEGSQRDEGGNVTSGDFAGLVRIKKYLGTQTAADGDLISDTGGAWTADHKLLGLTYLTVRMKYDSRRFSSVPNITALVYGKNNVFDPRSGSTGYTDNWALCVRDYLTADFGLRCTADEVDDGYFISAANLADEFVWLNSEHTASQRRYAIGGSFTLDQTPLDIMDGLTAAGAGALVYIQGKYRLFGGAYQSPTISISEPDFADHGEIELQTMPPRSSIFNGVKGRFVDPAKFWQVSDFPPVQDTAAVGADGAEQWKEIDLAWITDQTRAQRVARQMLLRNRRPLIIKAPLRYASLQLCAWDVVAVSLADFGWSSKPFRVTSWDFDLEAGRVTATMQEEVASSYSWIYDDALPGLDVPRTTLVSPLDLPSPVGIAVTPTTSLQADGAVLAALLVTWTAPANPFVNGYEVQWRAGSGDPWKAIQVPAGASRAIIAPVQVGWSYDVRVRALSGLTAGPWSSVLSATGAPDSTAPGNPTGPSVVGVPRGFALRWTNPSDPDLDRVLILESPSGAGGSYTQAANSYTNSITLQGYSPGDTRHFIIRAIDRSGNESGNVFVGSATVPRNATNDIQSFAVSGVVSNTAYAYSMLSRPTSGYVYTGLVGATIDVQGDASVMIFYTTRGVSVTLVGGAPPPPGGGADGLGGGGDGGGGGGGE